MLILRKYLTIICLTIMVICAFGIQSAMCASAEITLQQNNSRIAFNGSWREVSNVYLEGTGNKAKYGSASGDTFAFSYYGTDFKIFGRTGTNYGVITFIVDDTLQFDINTDNGKAVAGNQLIYQSSNLAEGWHTVKGINNSNKALAIQSVKYLGKNSVAFRYDDLLTNSVAYSAGWVVNFNGHYNTLNNDGVSCEFKFTGVRLDYYIIKRPSGGKAHVSVDGGAPVTIDYYDAGGKEAVLACSFSNLENIEHTIKIIPDISGNQASGRTLISLDFFDVHSFIDGDVKGVILRDKNSVNNLPTGSTIKIDYNFYNSSVSDKDAIAILALYSGDKCEDMQFKSITLTKDIVSTNSITYILPEIYDPQITNYTLYAYLWNDTVNMKPYSVPISAVPDGNGDPVSITSVTRDGNVLIVQGHSSESKGNVVTLLLSKNIAVSTGDIVAVKQATLDENSNFSEKVQIEPDNTYYIYAAGAMAEKSIPKSYYAFDITFLLDINSAQTNDGITAVLKDSKYYQTLLKLNALMDEYNSIENTDVISNISSNIYNKKPYDANRIETFVNTLNESILLSNLKFVIDADAVIGVMKNYQLAIDGYTVFGSLPIDYQKYISQQIYNTQAESPIVDLVQLNSLITAYYNQYKKILNVNTTLESIENSYYGEIRGVLANNENILELTNDVEYIKYKNTVGNDAVFLDKYLALITPLDTIEQLKTEMKNANLELENNKKSVSSTSASGSHGGGQGSIAQGTTVVPIPPKPQATTATPELLRTDIIKPMQFNDLAGFEWAMQSIKNLYDKGIINGVTEKEFEPNQLVKKEEFVKMIVLAKGLSSKGNDCNFTDLNQYMWPYEYIATAVKENLVKGKNDNSFGIGDNISREDAVLIIYRAMKDLKSVNTDVPLVDIEQVSDYAKDAVKKMYSSGIIAGFSDNTFKPNDSITRVQAVVLINRAFNIGG